MSDRVQLRLQGLEKRSTHPNLIVDNYHTLELEHHTALPLAVMIGLRRLVRTLIFLSLQLMHASNVLFPTRLRMGFLCIRPFELRWSASIFDK